MKKALLIAGVIIAGIAIWCCIIFFSPFANDLALNSFAIQLSEIPLPENTIIVDRMSKCGNFGNGNHLDFMAVVLLETKFTKEEIVEYYSTINIHPAKPGVRSMFGLGTEQQLVINDYPTNITTAENIKAGHQYYEIKIVDVGYESLFDIRGH